MQKSLQLKEFMRSRRLVRFNRRFEEGTVRGYVLDVGPKFFLMALVSDQIWFDGFGCFRVSDVRQLRVDPYSRFAEEALKKRGEKKPGKPRVSVKTVQDLVLSAGRSFPLVTLHREEIDPDVCWIGRVLEVTPEIVTILEICPDGSWESSPEKYRLSEITQVDFGGNYEDALYLVGGEPPTRAPRKWQYRPGKIRNEV